MIDGTTIRAHRHAAGAKGGQEKQGLGRSCGGFSSKIHAKVDSFGMGLKFIITEGQASEIKQVKELIGDEKCEYLLADRGYDSDSFRESLTKKGITPVIPGRKNRKKPIDYDKHIYNLSFGFILLRLNEFSDFWSVSCLNKLNFYYLRKKQPY